MMKWIAIALLGAGLLASAVFGIVWMNGQESIAASAAKKAESEEAAANSAERKARSEAAAEASRASAKAAELKIAEEKRAEKESAAEEAAAAAAKAKDDRARAEAEAARAESERKRFEAESEKSKADRDAKAAEKEKAKLEAQKAKSLAEAESLKAQAAADALAREKLRSEAVVAEAKLYEAQALDLANLERELRDYKRELDERERALRPEKTIKDLASTGEGEEEERRKADGKILPENDKRLPRETRTLAKASRESAEESARLSAAARSNTVSRLERLYVEAVKEDRMVDADFYRVELKRMYPDWKYVPEEKREKGEGR